MATVIAPVVVLPAARLAARTRHNTTLRLLPFLFALYLANYLDRTSVAYAAIGMTRERCTARCCTATAKVACAQFAGYSGTPICIGWPLL